MRQVFCSNTNKRSTPAQQPYEATWMSDDIARSDLKKALNIIARNLGIQTLLHLLSCFKQMCNEPNKMHIICSLAKECLHPCATMKLSGVLERSPIREIRFRRLQTACLAAPPGPSIKIAHATDLDQPRAPACLSEELRCSHIAGRT